MIKSYGLDTNNHSVYKLNYHLIITTKYRQEVITHEMSKMLTDTFETIGKKYSVCLKEIGYEKDHVHFLFSASPTTELSKFINVYKSATSRKLRASFPNIKKKLWNGVLWSPSYFLVTAGGAPLEIIRQYIQDQGYMNEEK